MSSYTPPTEIQRLASDANTSLGRVVGEVDVDVLIPYEIQKLFGSLSETQRLTQTGLALLARLCRRVKRIAPPVTVTWSMTARNSWGCRRVKLSG